MALRQDSEDGVELTEKIVLTRTRASDLDSVKKLNCWASNISDVSVVRKLQNLEVCSLSINRIATLRDFAHCYKLKELYVRTNRIGCLGDIHYLKNLSRLKYLWLSENPCADADNYRLTVLRTLPRLQKLDNTAVTQEEVQEALATVDEIQIPDDFSASSMFNRPLNISSVSSVSSMSCVSSVSGVLSPRSSNADDDCSVSPRDGIPAVRRKREQRRLRKADEETARRSAEEEFVRTSLERKKDGNGSGKEGGSSSDDDDESVSDDVTSSTGSDNSGSKRSPLSDDGLDKKDISGGSCGDDKQINGSYIPCNENAQCNVNNDDYSNDKNVDDNAIDQKEIIVQKKKEIDSGNNYNNNNNDDKLCEFPSDGAETSRVVVKQEVVDDVQADMTGESLLDKIRLDDSLAVDENEDDAARRTQDSVDLDDLMLEVTDENQTLTENKNSCNDNDSNNNNGVDETIKDDSNGELDPDSSCVVKMESEMTGSSSSGGDSVQIPSSNHCLTRLPTTCSTALTSSPRSGSDSDNKTTSLPHKDPIDWDQYNRMRQEVGMKPIETQPPTTTMTSSRPTTGVSVAKVRNGNILQAVLSLVKELDKDSLDLVASAVKVRMDGL